MIIIYIASTHLPTWTRVRLRRTKLGDSIQPNKKRRWLHSVAFLDTLFFLPEFLHRLTANYDETPLILSSIGSISLWIETNTCLIDWVVERNFFQNVHTETLRVTLLLSDFFFSSFFWVELCTNDLSSLQRLYVWWLAHKLLIFRTAKPNLIMSQLPTLIH